MSVKEKHLSHLFCNIRSHIHSNISEAALENKHANVSHLFY